MQEGCGYVSVTCHTTNLTSCHPLVTQHCESPWQGQLFTGSRSPHLPHCLVLIDLMRPRARASSWRINNEIYSAMSYGSLPGRRAAQLRASISSSCASSVNSILRSPAAAWRARCFALRTAADSGITHRPALRRRFSKITITIARCWRIPDVIIQPPASVRLAAI